MSHRKGLAKVKNTTFPPDILSEHLRTFTVIFIHELQEPELHLFYIQLIAGQLLSGSDREGKEQTGWWLT